MKLTKAQSRMRWAELRDLACEWDPIGTVSSGGPKTEYDCLLGPILRLLESGESQEHLFVFLDGQLKDHFDLPDVSRTREFARRVTGWYAAKWPESSVQDGLAE